LNAFPINFYQGDALGSFNSWMRLITGVLFGIALVAFAFPCLNNAFAAIVGRREPIHIKGLQE
jgi:hypothetical protein